MSVDLSFNSPGGGEGLSYKIRDGELVLYNGIYSAEREHRLFHTLLREIKWRQETITLFDKQILSPRLQAWFGDPGVCYSYSGLVLRATGWPTLLGEVRTSVERLTGHSFNAVLLNRYRDGRDSMGWHSDDERELGANPVVASLSLGAERVFKLQHKQDKSLQIRFSLGQGDLLLMRGRTQHFWRHSIAKTTRPVGERINLTFRRIAYPPVAVADI